MTDAPLYKILIVYNIRPETNEQYYRYLLGEFVPALQKMGIRMYYAWHVAYGDYPTRQVEFVCDTLETVRAAFENPRWGELETGLKSYTSDYQRKLVRFENRFQF